MTYHLVFSINYFYHNFCELINCIIFYGQVFFEFWEPIFNPDPSNTLGGPGLIIFTVFFGLAS